MADKIKIRRGALANIPILDEGEFGLVTDRNTVYIGTDSDGNVLLNPIQVADDGYFLDGYLYPAVDNVHGLGTPDKRWQGVSVGPGSIHIIVKDTDPGYTTNSEFKIGINPDSGKLQFSGNGNVLVEMDPVAGVSIDGLASEITVDEHYIQHSTAIQTILKDLDGYQAQINAVSPDITFQEFKAQQSQINKTIIQSLDGYAQNWTDSSQQLQDLRNAADGYATLISGLDLTELQHTQQQNQINQTIIQSLDGYAQNWADGSQQLQDLRNAADGYGITISENNAAQAQVNQTIIQSLDGYATLISGLDSTELQHRQQQNQINQSVLQALDGYAIVPDPTAIGDGYLAFFIDGAKTIAGDNDLYFNRSTNILTLGGGGTYVGSEGTAANPTYATGVSNTGIFLDGSGNLAFTISGTQYFQMTGGGILTTTAGGLLQVAQGNLVNVAYASNAGSNTGIYFPSGSIVALAAAGSEVARFSSAPNLLSISGDLNVAGGIYNKDLSETIGALRQASDGYAFVPDTAAIGDGYLAFFIDGGRQLAGDNDFYFDRTTHNLSLTGGGVFNLGAETTNVDAHKLHIGNESTGFGIQVVEHSGTAYAFSGIEFKRSRGSLASRTTVASGDTIGSMRFRGYNGSGFNDAALIEAIADTTVSGGGASDMPTRLAFHTTPDGSGTLVERMRIGNGGRTTIGGDGTLHSEAIRLHLPNNATGSIAIATAEQVSTGDNDQFHMRRARGTYASRSIVSSGDMVGSLVGLGYDGSTYQVASRIDTFVDGTPGSTDMPGRLVFSTTPDGSGTTVERMRITNDGRVGINTNSPQSFLHVAGDGYFDGYLMPFTDDTWGLGTPTKRWRDLYLGPGSLHIIASAAQVGVAQDWTVGTTGAGDFSIANGTGVMSISTDGKITINANNTPIPAAYGYYWVREDGMDYVLERNDTSATGLQLRLQKARGAFGAPVAVIDGDALGQLQFHGWDGATFLEGARISARVDGTPGTNDLPTSLVFYTTSDGAATPTEAARLKPDNSFHLAELAAGPTVTSGFGSVYPTTAGNLHFKNDAGQDHNVSKGYILAASYVTATSLTAPNSYFFPPVGLTLVNTSATEADHRIKLKGPGSITGIRIQVSTNTLATANGLMTLRINGSVVATITITVGGGTGEFTTATIPTFADGDYLCWQFTSAGATGSVVIKTIQCTII